MIGFARAAASIQPGISSSGTKALLTKSSTILLLPPALLAIAVASGLGNEEARPTFSRELVRGGAATFGVALLISGAWLVRNQVLYGDPLGQRAFDWYFRDTVRWEAFRAGQPRLALGRTREARQLVSRAMLQGSEAFSEERVRRELDATSGAIERAQGAVEASGVAAAASVLETSRTHQARAAERLGVGDAREALAQTLVARRLASRAQELAQGSGR